MKNIPLLLSVLFFSCTVNATPVSQSTGETLAKNFFTITTGYKVNNVAVAYTEYDKSNTPVYYVFNINQGQNTGQGFVIVSAENATNPVLAYGNENKTYTVPSTKGGAGNVLFWMNKQKTDIITIRNMNLSAAPSVAALWAYYLNNKVSSAGTQRTQRTTGIFPSSSDFLVQSQWAQYTGQPLDPYAYFCPYNSVTGCVATAQAQIMRYWSWPSYGRGASCDSMSDYSNVTICDSYSRSYDWNNMTLISPPNGDTAIARLMYDIGISVGMEYSSQGSDAQVIDSDAIDSVIWKKMDTACAQNSLVKYFRYNKATISGRYQTSYSNTTWLNMLKHDLDSNRPINYAGYNSDTLDGHSWICDGYDASDNFHFNFGWGGYDNGWYALSNLSPWYTGITFNTIMEAVLGIQPDTNAIFPLSVLPVQAAISNISAYPNPSKGVFTFKSSVISGQLSAEVYNMLGEKIYSNEFSTLNSQFSIDLTAQPSGIYLYRITDMQGSILKEDKLVISN